jgi:hypothetical protein
MAQCASSSNGRQWTDHSSTRNISFLQPTSEAREAAAFRPPAPVAEEARCFSTTC